jgi:DNA modification methylase
MPIARINLGRVDINVLPPASSKPFYSALNGDVRLYLGDVREVLSKLPAQSVHNVVTSPPYWGLRDYKTGSDLELGSERTPEEFVANMVVVFREAHRVLRDDGTLWLNLGDAYLANGNMAGTPWRVALALQADGWILRQDIIWHKPSPMPESVTNRCTKAHEYIFLLTKRKDYYYDAFLISEESNTKDLPPRTLGKKQAKTEFDGMISHNEDHSSSVLGRTQRRNKRSVWTVTSQGYEGAHFASFPEKLIEPCILAGTPQYVCDKCGAPRTRIIERKQLTRERPNDYVKRTGEAGTGNSCSNSVAGVDVKTVGWQPTCDCNAGETSGTVLDPFIGSGTVNVVALRHGRKSIGIDLSEQYLLNNAIPRIEGFCHDTPELAARIAKPRKALVGQTLLK